jgi:hypothetical protein
MAAANHRQLAMCVDGRDVGPAYCNDGKLGEMQVGMGNNSIIILCEAQNIDSIRNNLISIQIIYESLQIIILGGFTYEWKYLLSTNRSKFPNQSEIY